MAKAEIAAAGEKVGAAAGKISDAEKELRRRKREIDARMAEVKGARQGLRSEFDSIMEKLRAAELPPGKERKTLVGQKESTRSRIKESTVELTSLAAEKKEILNKLKAASST